MVVDSFLCRFFSLLTVVVVVVVAVGVPLRMMLQMHFKGVDSSIVTKQDTAQKIKKARRDQDSERKDGLNER